MKALQATCIVGAITFTGIIHQVGGSTSGATAPDAMPEAAVSADSIETKSLDLGHHDAAQPVPTTRDASDDASNPAPVTQDFRYLIYYVWSELPPREAGGDRFKFIQGDPGRNAARGDQARF